MGYMSSSKRFQNLSGDGSEGCGVVEAVVSDGSRILNELELSLTVDHQRP